jgi:hypothetical protein
MVKRALITASLAAAFVVGGAATFSSAAPKIGFDLRAKGVETKGLARSVGYLKLDYKPSHRKVRVVVKGTLNDVCPKDGHGAYLEIRAYYNNPDATLAYSSDRAADTRNCKPGPIKVALRTGYVRDPYEIELQLYEYDNETGDIAFNDEARVEYTLDQLGG